MTGPFAYPTRNPVAPTLDAEDVKEEKEEMKRSLLGFFCLSFTLLAEPPAATQEQKDFFENRIRPVLAQNCFACHTNSQMGGLRLDSLDGLLKGGKSGPAVIPGAPEAC